jgi:hypothetical protein
MVSLPSGSKFSGERLLIMPIFAFTVCSRMGDTSRLGYVSGHPEERKMAALLYLRYVEFYENI